MSRWFRGATKAQAPSMDAATEDRHLQDVELALLKLLNDEVDEANAALKKGNSSYHYVGRGISSFIASVLGAEKELLKGASALLQEAENKSWEDMKRAQHDPAAYRSAIYPPGTEYLLCYSVAQLTNAICHVMSGSVTEAIKGFYKLRKAHLTLHGIIELESRHFKSKLGKEPGLAAAKANSAYLSRQNTRRSHMSSIPSPAPTEKDDPFDHERSLNQIITVPDGNESAVADGDLPPYETKKLKPVITRTQSRLLDVDPSAVGIQTHTDIFIHSGARLCYGILMVVFSMIENPMFTKILYIVGFQGDRDRGTRYLWQSARFSNFNSAIAGMTLLGYYNGLVGSSDVLPTDPAGDDDLAGYPQERCENLLSDMRRRYPNSKLWKLEEARMCGHKRELEEAVKILLGNSGSNMAQIASYNCFEQGLTTMFSHHYELCAKSWIQCAELSSWSPTQYAFMTGIAYLELYREAREHNVEAAKTYKQKATDYIRKAPPLAGRQKVMNKELPFDTYVKRKVLKWESRAKAWGVDMVDATGVSPITEMIFLWNGVKKQGPVQLQKSLDALQWRRATHPEKFENDLDEQAIHAVISACVLRNKKDYEKAKHVLQNEVLPHQRQEFKTPNGDDWSLPFAHYEMAAIEWAEKDLDGADATAHVNACQQWLEKAQKWPEQYIMDTRLSVKIMTSLVTVKRHRRIMAV